MKTKSLTMLISAIALTLMSISCVKDENCNEKVDNNCFYTMDYNPVCGCNDKTYSNSGHAECSGITDYTEGTCR